MSVHDGKSPGFFSKEQVIEWHAKVLSRLCQEAAEVGVTIVLEHTPCTVKLAAAQLVILTS
jgi:hypothetical protein